ncbi:VanZ like family protein [compost metagenome]
MNTKKERLLGIFAWGMFIVYLLVLVRIVLFKDTQIYNLFAMIGRGQRVLNIIPITSTFEMMNTTGLLHNLQNIAGNLAMFFPMGILIPLLMNKGFKQTVVLVIGISVSIEVAQYILAIGISDIDDVILNTVGAIVGWSVFQYIKGKIKRTFIFRMVIVGMMIVFGFVGILAILTTETRLFQFTPKKVTVTNPELIDHLDYGSIYVTGKFMGFNAPDLTIEKAVQNLNQTRETITMALDQNTRIILEEVESNFFFDMITSEKYAYSSLTYDEFLPAVESFNRNHIVTVWSADGRHVDTIIIINP